MESDAEKNPFMLIILDGWGIGVDEPTNAVMVADTPFWTGFRPAIRRHSCAARPGCGTARRHYGQQRSGPHEHRCRTRIVYQDLMRIDKAIEDGSFFENAPPWRLMDDGG
jgi:2,3-bisphosphoglycerate-independent phosphoglycerate mutase